MKNYKLLLSILASGAVMMFNLAASADDGTKNGVVSVRSVQGNAEYSIDGGHAWIPLVAGKNLSAGSIVRTEDLSSVDLLIGKSTADKYVETIQIDTTKSPARNILPQVERNMVRLRPNTTLGIDKLIIPGNDPTVISDCQLDLKKGKIYASIKKVTPSSEYFIKLPNGVAAVRGTQIELSTDGTVSGSFCGVVSGTVWLSFTLVGANGAPITNPDGSALAPLQITLTPGQTFSLTAALTDTLISQAHAPGNQNVTAAVLAALLVTTATSTVAPLSPAELNTVTTVLVALATQTATTIAVTITENNGQPPHISTQ